MIVLIDNVGFASGFLAASDYAEYLLPHSHVIRCYGPYYRSSAILPTSSLSHHSRTTWGGSMLKRRFVGRGMHLEFRHPDYSTPTITSPIQEIQELPLQKIGDRDSGVIPSFDLLLLAL
jgi:hypothetical protein